MNKKITDNGPHVRTPPGMPRVSETGTGIKADTLAGEQAKSIRNSKNSKAIASAASFLDVEKAVIEAIIAVESTGYGYLDDGRVKILFEGHVFWRELKKIGLDPAALSVSFPNIIYPKWDRRKYKGGAREWERLDLAQCIDFAAALKSTSWGLFQIMGFNYALCGFDNVNDFVGAQIESETAQILSFCQLVKKMGWDKFLRQKNFSAFARAYNGPGYAQNSYHIRLAKAYMSAKEQNDKGQGMAV